MKSSIIYIRLISLVLLISCSYPAYSQGNLVTWSGWGGTFQCGTVTVTQTGNGIPQLLSPYALCGTDPFEWWANWTPTNQTKSLTFTFSTPVTINKMILGDLTYNADYIDNMSFSGVTFGTFVSSGSPQVYPTASGLNVSNIGHGEATWTNSTTTITSFTIEHLGNGSNAYNGVICMQLWVTPPSFNIDAGPDQSLCNDGTMVTLYGSGNSGISYVWDNGVIDGVPFSAPLGTTTYTVTGTDVNGCTSTDQVNVTVLGPIVNAGPDQSLCGTGLNVVLSGSGTGAPFYSWDNGVVDAVPFIPPIGTTTYTLSGTDSSGCTSTDQVDVTAYPIPIVDAGPDQTECGGASISLNGTGAVSYTWDNGVIDNVLFSAPSTTTTYTVIGTDGNGCTNTDLVDVIVSELIVDAGPDQSFCDTGAMVILAGSGSGTGVVNYIWDNGVIDNVPFNPPLGTTTFIVSGTDSSGCTNTDQVNVTVHPFPLISAGPDQAICGSASLSLNGTGGLSYVWDNGVIDNVAFNPPFGNTTYTVTGTDVNGCTNTDQVNLIVYPLPIINAGPDQSLCNDGSMVILSGSGNGIVNYSWDNGVVDNVAFIPPLGSTTYTLNGIDSNGCANTDQVVVNVGGDPVANFSWFVIDPNDFGYTIDLFNLSSPNVVSYEWIIENGVPPNANSENVNNVNLIGEGSFEVILIVTDEDGCMDTISLIIPPNENLIFYVPNTFTPDGDQFNQIFSPVFTSGFDPFDFKLQLYNRWGELIFESNNAAVGWDGIYNGEMAQIGTYTWKIDFKTSATDERKSITGHVNLLK